MAPTDTTTDVAGAEGIAPTGERGPFAPADLPWPAIEEDQGASRHLDDAWGSIALRRDTTIRRRPSPSVGSVSSGPTISLRLRRLALLVLVPAIADVGLLVSLHQGFSHSLLVANTVAIGLTNLLSYGLHREIPYRSDPYMRWVYIPSVFALASLVAATADMLVLAVLADTVGFVTVGGLVAAKVVAISAGALVRLVVHRAILGVNTARVRRRWTVRAPAPGAVRLSVVVPAYNEADRIAATLGQVRAQLAEIDRKGGLEVVIVDDGSVDGTGDAAAAAGADQVVRQPANRGKGAAVRAGVLAARGRTVVFTDADLAYAPRQVLQILGAVEAGCDVAIGDRRHPDTETLVEAPLARVVGSKVTNVVVRSVLLGSFRDTQSGLKGCRSDVGRFMFSRARVDGFAFDIELLHLAERHGFSIGEVPVEVTNSERSTVKPMRDFSRLIWDIVRIRHWSAVGAYEPRFEQVPAAAQVE